MQVPFELVGAVQDLYDLYLRQGPAGPYRMELFHDQVEEPRKWPEALRKEAQLLDRVIRGVSCLMANDLAEAALPLIAEVWRGVRRIEKRALRRSGKDPAYYNYISFELSIGIPQPEAGEAVDRNQLISKAYFLFGEVIAVYLDAIATVRGDEELTVQVSQLRGKLAAGLREV